MHLHYLVKLEIRVFCENSSAGKATEKILLIDFERDYVTFGSLLSQFRLSSVCLSVCNVAAPYSGG